MATGSAWAQLSVPADHDLHISHSDLKDCFYHLGLDDSLFEFFSLPPISSDDLRAWGVTASSCHGFDVHEGTHRLAWPHLCVVPMGWSWAAWIAQKTHEHQVLVGSGLSKDRVLTDGSPAPSLPPSMLQATVSPPSG